MCMQVFFFVIEAALHEQCAGGQGFSARISCSTRACPARSAIQCPLETKTNTCAQTRAATSTLPLRCARDVQVRTAWP